MAKLIARRLAAGPGAHLIVLLQQADNIRRSQFQTDVQLVYQQILYPLMFLHIGQENNPLDLRQIAKTRLGRPPVRAQIPDPLRRLGQRNFIWASDHWPAPSRVVIGESRRILASLYMLGNDGHAIAVNMGEIAGEKARVGRFEGNSRSQIVQRYGLLDPGVHIGRNH